jgi:hypothetical protein
MVNIRFILDDKLFFVKLANNVPQVGDEFRIGGKGNEKYYRIDKRVWVYDEDGPHERVNIGITDVTEVDE